MHLKDFIKKLITLDVFWGRRSKIFHGVRDGGAKATSISNDGVAKEWNGNTIFNVNHPDNECFGGHYHDPSVFPDPERLVIREYECNATLQPGDLVRQSLTTDKKVLKVTDNIQGPALGIVMSKPTPTTAKVLIIGIIGGFTGLARGKKVYVSSTGIPTSTQPASNYIQVLGIAISSSEFYLKPEYIRIKRV